MISTQGYAASAVELDAKANASLKELYAKTESAKSLSKKSAGILISPAVYKAGFGIGGEYGEGVLRIKGKTVDYYLTAGASIGFQLGAQKKKYCYPIYDTISIVRLPQQSRVGSRR